MNEQITDQILALADMKIIALRQRYLEVFREPTESRNAAWLRKRIAWRIQSLAEGGLSERARERAAELANEADLRMRAPTGLPTALARVETVQAAATFARDPRLPKAGTLLSRTFKGRQIVVTVLDTSFSFEGREYKSLSAIAGEVTGTRWNGFQFFGLKEAV
jgi:hypothetical protein